MNSIQLRNSILCLAILLLPAAAWATPDVTPPALVSYSFAPSSVDVSATSQTIAATVEATDNSSGVASIYSYFLSPSGNQQFSIYFQYSSDNFDSDLFAGTPLDGMYSSYGVLGTCSEPGLWTLTGITVTDACGNSTSYAAKASGATLAFPANTATALVVTNTNNISPAAPPAPAVTGFTFTPTSIDLSTTNAITVTVTGSNITSGNYYFRSPTGNESVGNDFTGGGAGITGTFTSTTTFYSPMCEESGTWTLEYVNVYDAASAPCGNGTSKSYFTPSYPPGTPVTTLIVTNTNVDTSSPTLNSISLSSTAVDVTNGDATLNAIVNVTGSTGGFSNGYAIYTSTSGQTLYLYFYNSDPFTVTSGTFPGSINVTTCDLSGTYSLTSASVSDETCDNTTNYTAPKFPAGILPSSFLVINGTATTASLTVTLIPLEAEEEFPSPNWYLDSGTNDLQLSGATLEGIAPGMHTVTFTDAAGYNTPGPQAITVAANENAFTTGTYLSTTPGDSVQVNLVTATGSAAPVGALWNVDNGPLVPSGTIVNADASGMQLADGAHSIEFTEVNGYVPPPTQIVMTASNQTTITTGTYTVIPGFGSLKVTLAPPGAITAGAEWDVDNGAAQVSGATVANLQAGGHTVYFTGGGTAYSPPSPQAVVISASATTVTSGTYTPLVTGTGSLTVTISPSNLNGSGWYLDADSADTLKGGATLSGIAEGAHTVNFAMVSGYINPTPENVTILPDETASTSGTYSPAPPFVGVATTFTGIAPNGMAILTLGLKDTGKFSGKLVTESAGSYTLGGVFNSTGFFAGQTGKPPVPYVLQVTGSTPGTYVLTGSANGTQLSAYPAAYAKGQTAAEQGVYTALFSGTDTSAAIPQGTGYGTLTVTKAGAGKLVGKLGDGTGYSASGVLVGGSGGNKLFLYDSKIYGKKGLLSGVLQFAAPPDGEVTGTFLWRKPAGKGPYYAAGFNTTLGAAGTLYVYNKANPVPFTSGTVAFSGGGLAMPVVAPFTVSSTGVVTIAAPTKLKFKASKGSLSGSFEPTGDSRPIDFSGLLLEGPGSPHAGGFFLGPVTGGVGLSGKVTVTAP